MKKFTLKYEEPDGSVKAEILHAESIEDARAMAAAICKIRKVKLLAINTTIL